LTVDEVNEFLDDWGRSLVAIIQGESRGTLATDVFDIPRRSCVAYECSYRLAPDMVRRIAEVSTPERIADSMKIPGARPYYLNAFVLMSSYLCGREQLLLDNAAAGVTADPTPFEDVELVVDFFARLMHAYRGDENETPKAPDWTQRVLSDDWARRCVDLLEPVDEATLARAERLAGFLSLYGVMLHGENRDGNFEHGPYWASDGRPVLIHEFSDLQNAFLPWATKDVRLSLDNVCFVYEYEGVELRFNMFGGVLSEPPDRRERLIRVAVCTREGEALRRIEPSEFEHLSHEARTAQTELYRRVLGWSRQERIEYGLWLYANHLMPFCEVAGAQEAAKVLPEEWQRIGVPYAALLAGDPSHPRLWTHLSKLDRPIFTPVDA
jgi:hypothetical protein